MKEKLAHLKELHTHDHVAERWPDIIDPTSVAKDEGVVVTKAGTVALYRNRAICCLSTVKTNVITKK